MDAAHVQMKAAWDNRVAKRIASLPLPASTAPIPVLVTDAPFLALRQVGGLVAALVR